MAHIRKRHIQPLIEKYLKFSPIVGILGHRQVGKTTLLGELCNSYYTLDDEESIAYLVNSAGEFLREISNSGLVAIDEAQLLPNLFPALKEWVRKHKSPGQFLISGSVRFTSQQSIRESLTGRIVNLELLPLTINELLERPPAERIENIHSADSFSERMETELDSAAELKQRENALNAYKKLGGLPGICFVRNDRLRKGRLSTQLNTLLDRDLRMIYSTRLSLSELRAMLRNLAIQQGKNLSLSEAAPKGRMNSSVLQKLVDAFEALFILRRIPIKGDYSGSTIYFEDLAEHQHTLGQEIDEDSLRQHLIFSVVRGALALSEDEVNYYQFKTRGGVLIPVVAESRSRATGFIPIDGPKPNRSDVASAKSFLSLVPNSKVIFVVEKIRSPYILDQRMLIASLANLTE